MAKKIFIIGAGRSASSLIKYLAEESLKYNFKITVGDRDRSLLNKKKIEYPKIETILFNVFNDQQRKEQIIKSDIVISMLPANLHIKVAKECIFYSKNLVTASYVSDEIKSLHNTAIDKGVLLLNEIGLDPGIDHMSAMKVIDEIKYKGGVLKSFKSYCGGLIAPEFDTNPWKYKFTWNPRNVVLAGKGTAQYIENGNYKYIPYGQLFKRTKTIEVLNYGTFEAYANRNSLSYRDIYGLNNIPTLFRGTLRRPGYSISWNLLVQMGLTDDSFKMYVKNMTYKDFFLSFINESDKSIGEYLKTNFGATDEIIYNINWLGFNSNKKINLTYASPAEVLQFILEEKWCLEEGDKDMIVMQHQFIYEQAGLQKELHSSFVIIGDDQNYTGMAKTVGLPVGIAAKHILNGQIKSTGVKVPVNKEIYKPVLAELEKFGITFIEEIKN